jgi:phage shock protein PspC (stress-responsive transcriptional regulator)
MEPVVTVNLGGNAYQLDQSAHEALRVYLERAAASLANNPDKTEILHDLEQAIADKCSAYLSAYKNVVSASEMQAIIAQMGPVEGAAEEAPRAEQTYTPRAERKLHRIRDAHSVTGVSAGLAAYFDVDVNLIRVLWVIGALFTSGFAIIAYFVLMFWMPLASTPEQVAAAYGAPFNAQDVIDKAKRNYQEYADQSAQTWSSWRREWRHSRREERRARARMYAQNAPPPPTGPFAVFARVFGAVFAVVFSLLGAALLIAFLFALFSLITSGSVLGWTLPGVPYWAAIVLLCIAYGAIAGPLGALQNASYSALSGRPQNQAHHDSGFGFLLIVGIGGWLA